jgi:predicted alpha/beta hydrolase family esterase
MTQVRIGLAPRWGGTAASDWYPWFERARRALGPSTLDVLTGGRPPVVDAWVPRLRRWLGDDPARLARTVLVGHSVGCQAWLRALSLLPERVEVAGLVCVAGWWSVDEPWPEIRPWTEADYDVARARAACPRVEVLLSDEDPFTRDFAANQAAWHRAGAQVSLVRGAAHFNAERCPPVIDTVRSIWPR